MQRPCIPLPLNSIPDKKDCHVKQRWPRCFFSPFQRSNLGALVLGPVDRIFVRVGDRVAKGAPLFRTRQADYQRRLNEALAAVRLARAEAQQAERTNERVQALKPRGFVSLSRVDEAETAVAVAKARVSQAEAVAATAQQALNDTIVRAPYDAVVTSRNVDEGVYLSTFGVGGQFRKSLSSRRSSAFLKTSSGKSSGTSPHACSSRASPSRSKAT